MTPLSFSRENSRLPQYSAYCALALDDARCRVRNLSGISAGRLTMPSWSPWMISPGVHLRPATSDRAAHLDHVAKGMRGRDVARERVQADLGELPAAPDRARRDHPDKARGP
jgi:hypothetical protein